MKRPKTQDGCLPHQTPSYVMDATTGELLDYSFVNETYVIPFLEYIRDKTKETVNADRENIVKTISEENKIRQPTGLAWKHNIHPNLIDAQEKRLLAISRIEKIIQHRIISELQSYINNTNPKKQEPTFESLKANLGAADKQICVADYDDKLHMAFLVWKCWTRELVFIFELPDFASDYEISKVCLPSVYYSEEHSRIEYDFPFVENLDFSRNEFHHCYGAYDAGRVEPYRLAFKNNKGMLIAEYRGSGRCRALNSKRERILANVRSINKKLKHYDDLGIPDNDRKRLCLIKEKRSLRAKAKAEGVALARLIGWEISRYCKFHGAAVIGAENLSWVSAVHGSSRWNFSVQQLWVERECQRKGTAFTNVSAKNSSQMCCDCGSKNIVHDNAKRTIFCKECHSIHDRDISASRVLTDRCMVAYRKYIEKVAITRIRQRC